MFHSGYCSCFGFILFKFKGEIGIGFTMAKSSDAYSNRRHGLIGHVLILLIRHSQAELQQKKHAV